MTLGPARWRSDVRTVPVTRIPTGDLYLKVVGCRRRGLANMEGESAPAPTTPKLEEEESRGRDGGVELAC